ncbi:MAG TPA: acetamidase/formamidase family protein, partial [Bauldia sp.]|nr:acetamidase/formamidase family protein [Bauldia sp.]
MMMTSTLSADDVVYAIDKDVPPRLRILPPAEVTIATLDARAGRLTRPEDVEATAPDYRDRYPKANPATGPIFVDGAEPGDVLTAEILRIALDNRGYTLVKPDFGVIRGMVERPVARFADVRDGVIDFAGVRLPLRPMVGVIATAPEGEPVGTAYVGRHGGNLDCNLIAEGARVHLPVRVGGALFYIGDVHAVMGDGEVSGSGFEIAAKVTVRLSLTKGGATEWPWLETAEVIATLAAAPRFDDAAEAAVRAMIPI